MWLCDKCTLNDAHSILQIEVRIFDYSSFTLQKAGLRFGGDQPDVQSVCKLSTLNTLNSLSFTVTDNTSHIVANTASQSETFSTSTLVVLDLFSSFDQRL